MPKTQTREEIREELDTAFLNGTNNAALKILYLLPSLTDGPEMAVQACAAVLAAALGNYIAPASLEDVMERTFDNVRTKARDTATTLQLIDRTGLGE